MRQSMLVGFTIHRTLPLKTSIIEAAIARSILEVKSKIVKCIDHID